MSGLVVAHRCGCWLEATELVDRLASTALRGVERDASQLVGVVSTLLGPEGTRGCVTSTHRAFSESKPAARCVGLGGSGVRGFLVVL
jgi:hypothetical protein